MKALAYGLPVLGLYAMQWVVSLYLLKFASEELLIAPALVGSILLISRIWDALNDPLIGFASDRTRTRFGRRRPWMLAGAPLLALAFAGVWGGPGDPGSLQRSLWFAAATVAFYTAFTIISVPHSSLGASLAREEADRNRLFAARGAFQNLGMGVAMATLFLLERADDPLQTARWMGVTLGGGAALLIALGVAWTGEPRSLDRPPRLRWSALSEVVRNADTRRILAALGFQELALGCLLVVLPFASDTLLQTPGRTAFYLIAFVVPMTLSLPLWVRLGKRFGLLRAWRLGNGIEALAFLPLVTLGAGDETRVLLLAAGIGIGHGGSRVLAMTSLAVAADRDARETGEAKEGLIFAASTFVEKCALGLSAFAVGLALQASGFETGPGGSGAGGAATEHVLRALASVVPATLLGVSCWILGPGRQTHALRVRSESAPA